MNKEHAFGLVFHAVEQDENKYSIVDFMAGVKDGTFSDENGIGYLVLTIDDVLYESHERINCSVQYLEQRLSEGWTHVCWHKND